MFNILSKLNNFSGAFGNSPNYYNEYLIEVYLTGGLGAAFWVDVDAIRAYLTAKGWKVTGRSSGFNDRITFTVLVSPQYSAAAVRSNAYTDIATILQDTQYRIGSLTAKATGKIDYSPITYNPQPQDNSNAPNLSWLSTAYTFWKDGIVYATNTSTNQTVKAVDYVGTQVSNGAITAQQGATMLADATRRAVTNATQTITPIYYDVADNVSDTLDGLSLDSYLQKFATTLGISIPLTLMVLLVGGLIVLRK